MFEMKNLWQTEQNKQQLLENIKIKINIIH